MLETLEEDTWEDLEQEYRDDMASKPPVSPAMIKRELRRQCLIKAMNDKLSTGTEVQVSREQEEARIAEWKTLKVQHDSGQRPISRAQLTGSTTSSAIVTTAAADTVEFISPAKPRSKLGLRIARFLKRCTPPPAEVDVEAYPRGD
ncbi:hypothetical protein MKZ38_004593 [Zalerion maritima]|uniref:Uncharacterized protein n=1 Tax=Zalerion maritima TaxID=339359 RepID=A0AAD5WWV3_9PEZI|nr:hypothetical protein MKZ38_004593 [Zalerion maritima]